MSHLRRLDGLDEVKPLLDADDHTVLRRLAAPTLLRVPGTDPRPRARFVATLLHGNEESGFWAVADLLRSGARFPFDLWVLIGNVAAALADGPFGHRYLEGQEDFNRVWEREPVRTPQRRMAAEVLATLDGLDLEAAIDLHNTTGHNPPHVIVPGDDPRMLGLAGALGDLALRWRLTAYTSMEAVGRRCPAVAVECGMAGVPANAAIAADVLRRFLHLEAVPAEGRPSELYEMRERVVVRGEVRFRFGGQLDDSVDLVLARGLDAANFSMLLAGTTLGWVRPGTAVPLRATDMADNDVTEVLLEVTGDGRVVLRHDVTPVMMTRDEQQTRRDCLFYVAQRR